MARDQEGFSLQLVWDSLGQQPFINKKLVVVKVLMISLPTAVPKSRRNNIME